jgi:hypothetical protein
LQQAGGAMSRIRQVEGFSMSSNQRLDGAGLTEQELLLVKARRRATRLAMALITAPFSPVTVAELRSYLASEAQAAQEAWDELCALPAATLRDRIAEVAGPMADAAEGDGGAWPEVAEEVAESAAIWPMGPGTCEAVKAVCLHPLQGERPLAVVEPRGERIGRRP